MTDAIAAALAAVDAANAEDPTLVVVRRRQGPKELLHAELVTGWVEQLADDPSDALRLAARAHHLQRWRWPRSSYPEGRAGYLRWRRDLHARHVEALAEVVDGTGVDPAVVARAGEIIAKKALGRDPEVQVLEDALCLVFIETQYADLAARLAPDHMADVAAKTLKKMSPRAQDLAKAFL
ncbi:MAG TPA: DUF4202 domain-containing protein [Acidimicrobiales bacterium]|nr:DUF4202 domain-containing protein [Acidimicrobiales bacterium]